MAALRVVFLAGGIASGKSTVARALEARGATRIDLDELSREVTAPGSAVCLELAALFGQDVLDAHTGALRREVLAQRAFETPARTRALEEVVHPAVFERLREHAGRLASDAVCVVEVPLLDRMEGMLSLADEVVCVTCPLALRRVRAIGRGMSAEDFDARVQRQPTDDYLVAHASMTLANDGDESDLLAQIDELWERVGG